MAYIVNKTDNTASPNQYTVQDGVINTQTDLSFIGKGYAGYGEAIAENFLHLLENFSNSTAPAKPIKGQLWFDSANNRLKVYTGADFVPSGGNVPYQATEPSAINQGDLWIDSDTGQLYFYNGSSSILVGPPASTGTKNGFEFETILDSTDASQNITKWYNDDVLVAIISGNSFTPKISISGFTTIQQGITLNSSTNVLAGTLVGNADTATEATNVTVSANNATNETVYLTFVDGETGTQGIETDTNLSYNPSTNVLSTTATSAQYADLAEMYVTKGMVDGNPYPVGTVMYVPEDIQRQAMPGCMPLEPAGAGNIPVGTISENPAFLMNNQLENGQPVALKGRVPIRVIGPCMAGEPVYVADGGVASINDAGQSSIHIVGIALVSKDTEEEELVECILKV